MLLGLPAPLTGATPTRPQVFVNFAKKQSDNVEQQEAEPSTLPSPLGLLSLLRPRPAPTELRALVAEEPEDLDTEDEGLISFEEERVSGQHLPATLLPRQCPEAQTEGPKRELAIAMPALNQSMEQRGISAW